LAARRRPFTTRLPELAIFSLRALEIAIFCRTVFWALAIPVNPTRL
jgi:hypothetical protein